MRQPAPGWCAVFLAASSLASPARADDRGAIASGSWQSPGTWLGNAVPGASDRAFIGSASPSGSASAATVTLTQNQAAAEVYLGNGAGTSGTLQLGNFALTTGQLVLGGGAGGTATVLRGTGALAVSETLTVNGTGNNSFTFAAGDVAGNLYLASGGRATTAAAGNVTGSAYVDGPGSRLTLGANLSLGFSNTLGLSNGGVLDAQGRAISIGSFGIVRLDAASALLNRGALTAGALDVTGQPFALNAADSVGNFSLSGPAATTALGSGVTVNSLSLNSGATATTTASGNIGAGGVTISGSGSRLTLGADLSAIGGTGGGVVDVSGGGVLDAQGRAITAAFRVSLDATSSLLNRGALTANTGVGLVVTGQPFNLTAADSVGGFSLSGSAATTALPAGVAVAGLYLSNGATATTASTGNVSYAASVDGAGSKLTLGANLSVSDLVTVSNGGALDAQGRNVAAGFGVRIGTGGGAAPVVQNLGTVTTPGGYTQAGASQVTVGAGSSAVGSLALSDNSTLAVKFLSGSAARLTVSGTATSALSIEAGSHLALTLDGNQPGYALRWADPAGGTHVAELNGFIASGAITINLTNGAQYSVFSDGNYSYVAVPVPEPGAVLASAAGVLGAAGWIRRSLLGRGVRRAD